MNKEDKHFIERYEELLNKGYCDCNEMNCIDNNSPRRILNIVKDLQSKIDKANKILNEPQFEYDNIPCNYEKHIEELKNVLKEDK